MGSLPPGKSVSSLPVTGQTGRWTIRTAPGSGASWIGWRGGSTPIRGAAAPHFDRFRRMGLERVRLLTDADQDTRLEEWTWSMLERQAENAVRLGIVGARHARRWLAAIKAQAEGARPSSR